MKKTFAISVICILVATGVFVNSCSKRTNGGDFKTTPLTFTTPPGFPEPQYKFEGNPLTREGFELGRKLFYDGILSKDGNFPCASCHQQFAAFATFDHDLSHGFDNQIGRA